MRTFIVAPEYAVVRNKSDDEDELKSGWMGLTMAIQKSWMWVG